MGTHKKQKLSISVGGEVVCGSRKLRLDAVDENGVAAVTLTKVKGEYVEIRDPRMRDAPWIRDNPGEGELVEEKYDVKIGHKIRIGMFRQLRILSFKDGQVEVAVIGPVAEVGG